MKVRIKILSNFFRFGVILILLLWGWGSFLAGADEYLLFESGIIAEEREQFHNAIEFYGKVNEKSILYPYSVIRKARCYLMIGNTDEAISQLRRLYEVSYSKDTPWKLLLILNLFSACSVNREPCYLTEVRDCLNTLPFNSWWLVPYIHRVGNFLLSLPDYSAFGGEILRKSLEYKGYNPLRKQSIMSLALSPHEKDRLYVLNVLVKGGNLSEAWVIMQDLFDGESLSYIGVPNVVKEWKATKDHSRFVEFLKIRGQSEKNRILLEYVLKALLSGNDFGSFQIFFEQLASLFLTDDEKGDLLYWCINVLEKRGVENELEQLCLRFVEEFPTHKRVPDVYFSLGFWYLKKGRSEDAYRCFSVIRDKYLDSHYFPCATYLCGKICEEKGDKKCAIMNYKCALKGKVGDYYVYKSAEKLYRSFHISSFGSYRFTPLRNFPIVAVRNADLENIYELMREIKEEKEEIWSLLKFFSRIGAEEKEWITYWLVNGSGSRIREKDFLLRCVNWGSPQVVWDFIYSPLYGGNPNITQEVEKNIMFPLPYFDVVTEVSKKYGVDPFLVWAIMRQESTYRTDVVSTSDARGLLQLLPSTAKWVVDKKMVKTEKDPKLWRVPEHNIEIGTAYFKYLLERFDGNVVYAISAYNAGPGSMRQWLAKGKYKDLDDFIENIPFIETRNYVKKVLGNYSAYHSIYESIK